MSSTAAAPCREVATFHPWQAPWLVAWCRITTALGARAVGNHERTAGGML